MEPEDFIVEELIKLKECSGSYLYIKVKKRNWNTIDLINLISTRLNVRRKDIGFAGIKDKNAITTQYISVNNSNIEKINRLKIKDVELTPLFYGDKPIRMGDLIGNKFKINLGFKTKKVDFIENYFGEQRFSKNNVDIARYILKKDFKKACELIDHKDVNGHLSLNKNDFIGALKKVDRKLLGLIVGSYQSYLFNRYVCDYLKNFKDSYSHKGYIFVKKFKRNKEFKLLSFDNYDDYLNYLKEDSLNEDDLIVRSIPYVLFLDNKRKLFVKVSDFKVRGNTVEFSLPKGSYATVVISKLESLILNNKFPKSL